MLIQKKYKRTYSLDGEMASKTLVVYYSFEGSTKLLAEHIAQVLHADLLECKPVKDLSSKGFSKYVWGGRQVIMKKKPKLVEFLINPNDYDVIIIGTPVWAFNYTPAIRSFLTQVKLKNKKIGVFYCHEGGPGKTLDNLKKKLSDNSIIGEMDFLNVAKNKEENVLKAKNWASSLVEKINS
jgi:flavodoxin